MDYAYNAAIGATAAATWIVSQIDTTTLPDELKWAQVGATGLCLSLLYWLIVRRMPALEDKYTDTIKHLVDTHHLAIKDVCDSNHECVSEIKAGQIDIVDAIMRGNDTQSQILRETIITKQKLEAKP